MSKENSDLKEGGNEMDLMGALKEVLEESIHGRSRRNGKAARVSDIVSQLQRCLEVVLWYMGVNTEVKKDDLKKIAIWAVMAEVADGKPILQTMDGSKEEDQVITKPQYLFQSPEMRSSDVGGNGPPLVDLSKYSEMHRKLRSEKLKRFEREKELNSMEDCIRKQTDRIKWLEDTMDKVRSSKKVELECLVEQINMLQWEDSENKKLLQEAKKREQQNAKDLLELNGRVKELEKEKDGLSEDCSELQTSLHKLSLQLKSSTSQLRMTTTHNQQLSEDLEKNCNEMQMLKEKLVCCEEEREKEKEIHRFQIKELQQKLDESVEVGECWGDVVEMKLRDEIEELQKKLGKQTERLDDGQIENKSLHKRVDALTHEKDHLCHEIDEIKKDIEVREEENLKLRNGIRDVQGEEKHLRKELEALQNVVDSLKHQQMKIVQNNEAIMKKILQRPSKKKIKSKNMIKNGKRKKKCASKRVPMVLRQHSTNVFTSQHKHPHNHPANKSGGISQISSSPHKKFTFENEMQTDLQPTDQKTLPRHQPACLSQVTLLPRDQQKAHDDEYEKLHMSFLKLTCKVFDLENSLKKVNDERLMALKRREFTQKQEIKRLKCLFAAYKLQTEAMLDAQKKKEVKVRHKLERLLGFKGQNFSELDSQIS